MTKRATILVTSHLVRRLAVLRAAREAAHGRQILSPAQAAARLAGGFVVPVSRDVLNAAVRDVLADPAADLGDMAGIRELPGMARAVGATLQRAWAAGVDLGARSAASGHSRLVTLHQLERAVQARLPPSQCLPAELVRRALQRSAHAPRVLGPITLQGVPDLDPVWRPLLLRLAETVQVVWKLGQVERPAWMQGAPIDVVTEAPRHAAVLRVSCANPRHEALEALRWARALLAGARARPEEIAIAAPTTVEWDAHLAAMADDANLPLAFVHGRPALATPDGQAVAALAEVLLNGLSRNRVRRVLSLIHGMTPATEALPPTWHHILPAEAPLLRRERWEEVIARNTEWPAGQNFGATLRDLVVCLDGGVAEAAAIGERLLAGRALAIWERALLDGPASALDVTLTTIAVEDDTDPTTSVIWCNAADAATAPRPFVRLLGLTSRGWPRTQNEDPLLPAHVLDPAELNPVPVPERDRRDYRTLLKSGVQHLVLSRSRRDAEGRQNGASALLRESGSRDEQELYLRREAIPTHALSEADRLLARPTEFATTPRARSARACWQNWHREALTPHDGLIRPNHPVLLGALAGRFSASRLRRLALDPLGFVWQYVFGWSAPTEAEEPLALEPVQFGNLTHRTLQLALGDLEVHGGFAQADPRRIEAAVAQASHQAAVEYERDQAVPPLLIWQRTLAETRAQAAAALSWQEPPLPGQRSFGEIPFGGAPTKTDPDAHWPWDVQASVVIPGTTLAIGGIIDRLDLASDRTRARVTDYKTGQVPKKEFQVAGGSELQRCLYASAVQVLVGAQTVVEARLLYPRDGARLLVLDDPPAMLARIAGYLQAARDHVAAGRAFPGPSSGERMTDDLTFALPGNATEIYLELKAPLAARELAPLPELWELE